MASVGSPLSSLDIVGAVGPRVSKRSEEGGSSFNRTVALEQIAFS